MLLLLAAGSLTGCDDQEKTETPEPPAPAEVTGEQATARFKSYFYEQDGRVRANKMVRFSEKEWAVAIENPGRPLEVFTDITGLDAPLTSTYDYTCRSSDGNCTLRIVGVDQPRADQVYAVMYVEIEACQDIGRINILTLDYYEDPNIRFSGPPLIL